MINIIESKIKFTYEPLPEIFKQTSKLLSENISNIFIRASEEMNNLTAEEAWNKSLEKSSTYLSKDDIEEILKKLKIIKAVPSSALEIMPPTPGFFFGSQDIDEWFIRDVEYSVELFEDVLEMLEKNDKRKNYYEIYYQASW